MSRHVLPHLAAARVGGADAAAFLHAQLSAGVAGLAAGGSTFACYCSPRGQVLGLLLVCRRADDFLLLGSAELLAGLLQRLRMYVLRAQVELSLLPDGVFGVAIPDSGEDTEAAEPAWDPGIGLGYRIGSPGPADASGAEHWRAQELAHGVAWLDARTAERFIPQMLGFERLGAVSFSKGCYPGQEIVARARYLGKVKRGPLRLSLSVSEVPNAQRAAWPETGSGMSLCAGSEQSEATLIDHAAAATGQIRMLVVAPLLDWAPQEVEIGGRRYGCATM